MATILIILTSVEPKDASKRFFEGDGYEWDVVWKFKNENTVTISANGRVKGMKDLDLKEIEEKNGPKLALWINGQHYNNFKKNVERLISLLKTYADSDSIYIAYHDSSIESLIIPQIEYDLKSHSINYAKYTFGKFEQNIKQFKPITKESKGEIVIDKHACCDFEKILNSFFPAKRMLFYIIRYMKSDIFEITSIKLVGDTNEYAQTIFEDKKDNYYKKKLVNLRYILSGDKNQSQIDGIYHDKDIMNIAFKSSNVSQKRELEICKQLVGLDSSPGNSEIVSYFKQLDQLIHENKINKLVESNKFQKIWSVKGSETIKIKTLGGWFTALINSLSKLV